MFTVTGETYPARCKKLPVLHASLLQNPNPSTKKNPSPSSIQHKNPNPSTIQQENPDPSTIQQKIPVVCPCMMISDNPQTKINSLQGLLNAERKASADLKASVESLTSQLMEKEVAHRENIREISRMAHEKEDVVFKLVSDRFDALSGLLRLHASPVFSCAEVNVFGKVFWFTTWMGRACSCRASSSPSFITPMTMKRPPTGTRLQRPWQKNWRHRRERSGG